LVFVNVNYLKYTAGRPNVKSLTRKKQKNYQILSSSLRGNSRRRAGASCVKATKEACAMPEHHETDPQPLVEQEPLEQLGNVTLTRGAHTIHCLTVIGQIEGHSEAPQGQKTTKYEHVIPQLVAVQEDPRVEGLLVLLNTVGGDVEAGLALAELIASVSKPSATLVLGRNS